MEIFRVHVTRVAMVTVGIIFFQSLVNKFCMFREFSQLVLEHCTFAVLCSLTSRILSDFVRLVSR